MLKSEQVEAMQFISIESLLQQNFDLVKMDIEGAEWPLLQQVVERNLLTKANYWMIELHDEELWSEILNSVKAKAAAQGYEVKKIKTIWHLFKSADRDN